MQALFKILLSALLIFGISELAKRSSLLGALLASLPLTSLLAIIWLYRETGNVRRIADLAGGMFWLVLPSLSFSSCSRRSFSAGKSLSRGRWRSPAAQRRASMACGFSPCAVSDLLLKNRLAP